jgi:hypothetical protein
MSKIGKFEKKLDPATESSFYPGIYKPRYVDAKIGSHAPAVGLRESSLFLPCHYFTYIGGTGTGGYVVTFI